MEIRKDKLAKQYKQQRMSKILSCNYNNRRFDVTLEGEYLLEKVKEAYGVDLERDCGISKIEFTRLLALLLNHKFSELWVTVNNYVDLYTTCTSLGLEKENVNKIIERMPQELMSGKNFNTSIIKKALIYRNVDLEKFNESVNKNMKLNDGSVEKIGHYMLNNLGQVNLNLASLSLIDIDGDILESYPHLLFRNSKKMYAICNYIKDNNIGINVPYFIYIYYSDKKMSEALKNYKLNPDLRDQLLENYEQMLSSNEESIKREK